MKEKVYLLCDFADDKARSIDDTPDIGAEYMGGCGGRIVKEDGALIGSHFSSSLGWLRHDLIRKLDDPSKYEIIDLINEDVPDKFKKG